MMAVPFGTGPHLGSSSRNANHAALWEYDDMEFHVIAILIMEFRYHPY
jgi:hypothetical protein